MAEIIMILTRGAVAQMDDTRKPGTFSQGTVTVEKQQQHAAGIQIGIYRYLITIKKAKITSKNELLFPLCTTKLHFVRGIHTAVYKDCNF